jgi:pimeloyl-ACP methyl ester carboxylesterase
MSTVGTKFTTLGLLLLSCTARAQSQVEACAALATWSEGAGDMQISEAMHYSNRPLRAGPPGSPELVLPPHCHVAGKFERRTGSDGKDYAITFALNLPDNWNGRYMFQGGGGLNGAVREPVGNQNAGEQSALAQGYAVVSNDSGHQGSGFDASFLADQQAMLNFYYEANAKVVNQTRPMVEAYYRQPPHHSYFVGCSTGGREGMIMAQRYPTLFDGIVSGAPAMRTGISNLALRWFSVELGKAADTNPRDPFTDAEEDLIMDTLLTQCDALDGQADKLIFNRSACAFDPVKLACSANPGKQCLADDKAAALAKAIAGPMTSGGEPVYVPFPWDSGLDDAGGLPGLLLAGGSPPEGLNGADMTVQNVDAEYIAAMAADQALGYTATQYNISEFISRGGKQLFFHGAADPWFSANETERYFNAMATSNASLKSVEDYSRLYLVPGMAHCAGGEQTLDNFDMLTPLVEWVENNQAPAAVDATGQSMPGQSRPLCPYPAYAHFEGGDASEAASYSCRMP